MLVKKGTKVADGLYFGLVFTDQLADHRKNNHAKIANHFATIGNTFNVNKVRIHGCQFFFDKISNLYDLSDTSKICDNISNLYNSHNSDFISVFKKYAQVFINNSGKISD